VRLSGSGPEAGRLGVLVGLPAPLVYGVVVTCSTCWPCWSPSRYELIDTSAAAPLDGSLETDAEGDGAQRLVRALRGSQAGRWEAAATGGRWLIRMSGRPPGGRPDDKARKAEARARRAGAAVGADAGRGRLPDQGGAGARGGCEPSGGDARASPEVRGSGIIRRLPSHLGCGSGPCQDWGATCSGTSSRVTPMNRGRREDLSGAHHAEADGR